MTRHVHKDKMHDSNYSQVCRCGAIRLRPAGGEWEPWHVCPLCALSPQHERRHANEATDGR